MDPSRTEQFTSLWTTAQPTLAAFIRTLVPDFQQAEEVLQRVAVALVRKFDQYDANRSFPAWAIGVAKFEVLYYRRQRATDKLVFDDELVEKIALSYQDFVEDGDPFREALENCLGDLKGRPRRAIVLRYEKGLESSAIAQRLRISTGAVRMLLCRARKLLRQCVEARLGPLGAGDEVAEGTP
jgi:RNA polymerase sigma-70 factor (ECF subfamily)